MFQFADLNAPYVPRLLEHPRFKANTDAIPKTDPDGRLSLIRNINTRYEQTLSEKGRVGYHLYFCDGSHMDGRAGAGVYTSGALLETTPNGSTGLPLTIFGIPPTNNS